MKDNVCHYNVFRAKKSRGRIRLLVLVDWCVMRFRAAGCWHQEGRLVDIARRPFCVMARHPHCLIGASISALNAIN